MTAKANGWKHLAFFAAGFIFDAFMVRRIDETPILIQQGVYLAASGLCLAVLIARQHAPTRWASPLLHFMLGTLLNAYVLFYVKSGSGFTAALFFAVIAFLLLINELPSMRGLGPIVLYALYSFCLTSYFAYLYPVLFGRIRWWMFILAIVTAAIPLTLIGRFHHRRTGNRRLILKHALAPSLGVQALLLVLYLFGLIPPVPLSLMEIGIYHGVERDNAGAYRVSYETPPWYRVWSRDDVDFRARAGDRVYVFFRVFAPRRFHDEIRVAWLYRQQGRGWQPAGDLPIAVTGGRESGFGGVAYKQNWRPGDWRVTIETADGREIGRRTFSVRDDGDTARNREMTVQTR